MESFWGTVQCVGIVTYYKYIFGFFYENKIVYLPRTRI